MIEEIIDERRPLPWWKRVFYCLPHKLGIHILSGAQTVLVVVKVVLICVNENYKYFKTKNNKILTVLETSLCILCILLCIVGVKQEKLSFMFMFCAFSTTLLVVESMFVLTVYLTDGIKRIDVVTFSTEFCYHIVLLYTILMMSFFIHETRIKLQLQHALRSGTTINSPFIRRLSRQH